MKSHLFCMLLGFACPHHSLSQSDHGSFTDYQEVQAFITDASKAGLGSPQQLQALFSQAEFQPAVLQAMSAPAEQSDWRSYQKIFLNDERLQRGLAFWNAHQAALQRAEHLSQVPASIIVAILGVETLYGRKTGHYRALDSLSTLAFDYPPRSRFFRLVLLAFLQLCQQQHLEPDKITGSYAGALGYPQFMPSSWLNMAVDFDQDGHIDLLNDADDAIGSIAHYFQQSGWKSGPVAIKATLQGNDYDKELNSTLAATAPLSHWATLGLTPATPGSLPASTLANVLRLHGDHGNEYWFAFGNFYAITQYNHSVLYAMAVWQLSQALENAAIHKSGL